MRLVIFLLFIVSTLASAEGAKSHAVSEAEFVGYWRVMHIPNELLKSKFNSRFKNEDMGYSDPCQFLIHKPDGTWYNLTISNMAGDEESKRQCPDKKSTVDITLFTVSKSPYIWGKVPKSDGLFFTKNTSITDPKAISIRIWKADYILEDIPLANTFGFDLKKGDLMLQATERVGDKGIAPVWPMILRPIQD